MTDDFFKQINKGNTTLAAFVDLRKAFDTVNLNILCKKLEKAGKIRSHILGWCVNYLTDRSQCTFANGITSDLLPVSCGVPQGSVLGPLFFLVYDDTQDALDACGLKMYADDTVLYQSGINSRDAANKLQLSLNLFDAWCSVNRLTINIKKTKLMAFGSRGKIKKAKNLTIKLGGQKLHQVPSFKYLGLTLDGPAEHETS